MSKKSKQVEKLDNLGLEPHIKLFIETVLFDVLIITDIVQVVNAFGLNSGRKVSKKYFYLKEFSDGAVAGSPATDEEVQRVVEEKLSSGPDSFGLLVFEISSCKKIDIKPQVCL